MAANDPQTGLIQHMEAMHYREARDVERNPWRMEPLEWEKFHGLLIPARSAVTWEDEGTPWLIVTVEEMAYNVDVDA